MQQQQKQHHPPSSQSFQNSRPQTAPHFRNENRRDFKDSSRWHDQSSSSNRNNPKVLHSLKQRLSEKDADKYSSKKDRNYEGVRDHDRDRDRDRIRNRERERDSKDRRDDFRRENRDRHSKNDCDERDHSHDRNKYPNRRRSRSFSREPSRSKSEHRSNYRRNDTNRSLKSQPRSSSRSSSIKRDVTPTPTKPTIDDESRHSIEKVPATDDANKTERTRILEKWRSNFCETSEDITRKLEELAEDSEKECWIRSSPADLYYKRTSVNEIEGTSRLEALCTLFKKELVERGPKARQTKPNLEPQMKKRRQRICRHKSEYFF